MIRISIMHYVNAVCFDKAGGQILKRLSLLLVLYCSQVKIGRKDKF